MGGGVTRGWGGTVRAPGWGELMAFLMLQPGFEALVDSPAAHPTQPTPTAGVGCGACRGDAGVLHGYTPTTGCLARGLVSIVTHPPIPPCPWMCGKSNTHYCVFCVLK